MRLFFLVNVDTIPLAPAESMQFGRALWRILTTIHKADPWLGPVFLSKVDIADGFYRIQVNANDVPTLEVVVPTEPGQPQLIRFPLVLPMGWMQSPPLFNAAMETVADLTNQALLDSAPEGPHRLDVVSESDGPVPALSPSSPLLLPAVPLPIKPMPRGRPRPPVKSWDVYVDDFLGMVQGNWHHRRHVKRVLLHTLDKVFRPPDLQDNPHRQEPASVKKMRKGDATWTTRKVILVWIIDTVCLTIELPAHRIARLSELLDSVPAHQHRISTNRWQQLVGELRSMVLAVPGCRGLFSVLQQVLKVRTEDDIRARLYIEVHAILRDFRSLARDLKNRPSHIAELIQADTPATIGAQDAAGTGMGGVHFVPLPDGTIAPLLWRSPFPPAVQTRLVSFSNPGGTITNSDLELAASVAQHKFLVTQVDAREATIHNFSDNTATVFWQRKGAVSNSGPTARLLRLQALHQRQHRYGPTYDYLPRPVNIMSDDCSRSWDLSDSQLLHHFNSSFPQTRPWRLCPLSRRMHSALISALLMKGSGQELPTSELMPWTSIGDDGNTYAWTKMWTRTSKLGMIPSQLSKSLANGIVMGNSPPCTTPSKLARWKTPSAQWARRMPDWGDLTHGKTITEASISGSNNR
jgi:hypothetical protein